MVVTISPSLSLYKIVVLPAASSPTIKILISFFEKNRLNNLVKVSPILFTADEDTSHTDQKSHKHIYLKQSEGSTMKP